MKNNLATFLLKLAPRPLMAIKCSGLKSFARMQQWSNHAQVNSFCRGVSPEFPDQILRRASSFSLFPPIVYVMALSQFSQKTRNGLQSVPELASERIQC